jgi:hypothetical protein
VVPGLVGLFIATRRNVSDCYAVAALAFALYFLCYWRTGPSIPGSASTGTSPAANLGEAARLVFRGGRLVRLVALSLINSAHGVIAYSLALLISLQLGGSTADIGWLSGLVAALEIPIVLDVGTAARRLPIWQVIVGGGVIHAGFLLALTMANGTGPRYALAVLNSIGNAISLT